MVRAMSDKRCKLCITRMVHDCDEVNGREQGESGSVCGRCGGSGFQGEPREGEEVMCEGACPECSGSGKSQTDRDHEFDEMMSRGRFCL